MSPSKSKKILTARTTIMIIRNPPERLQIQCLKISGKDAQGTELPAFELLSVRNYFPGGKESGFLIPGLSCRKV